MRQADIAFLIMVTVLSKISRHRNTVLSGSLFFFRMRWSSFKATTHLVFSLSESANIRHWCRTPGGSMRLVVTLKMQGTSFLLAWMTSDSRTLDTSNSGSLMSNTYLVKHNMNRGRIWDGNGSQISYLTNIDTRCGRLKFVKEELEIADYNKLANPTLFDASWFGHLHVSLIRRSNSSSGINTQGSFS